MKNLSLFAVRILISLAAGCLVAVIACLVAWLPMRWMPSFGPKVQSTLHTFSAIESMLMQHQQGMNALPRSLAELRRIAPTYDELHWDQDSHPLDAWGRPILYSVEGGQFTLSSFGRDGKPGGVGLDADLVRPDADPEEFMIPFHQFVLHEPARGVVATCVVCGIVVFFVGMVSIAPSAMQSKAGIVAVLLKVVVTILGAVIAAAFITALHIPNHH